MVGLNGPQEPTTPPRSSKREKYSSQERLVVCVKKKLNVKSLVLVGIQFTKRVLCGSFNQNVYDESTNKIFVRFLCQNQFGLTFDFLMKFVQKQVKTEIYFQRIRSLLFAFCVYFESVQSPFWESGFLCWSWEGHFDKTRSGLTKKSVCDWTGEHKGRINKANSDACEPEMHCHKMTLSIFKGTQKHGVGSNDFKVAGAEP